MEVTNGGTLCNLTMVKLQLFSLRLHLKLSLNGSSASQRWTDGRMQQSRVNGLNLHFTENQEKKENLLHFSADLLLLQIRFTITIMCD